MNTWHYAFSASDQHTVSKNEIPGLIQSGVIRRDTKVWTEGMPSWTPAGEIFPELFSGSTPPPLHSAPPIPPLAPQTSPSFQRQSHEIEYEILGGDMQLVEIELDPGDSVIAEAGAMCFMEDGISFDARLGDGSQSGGGLLSGLLSAGKRLLTGASLFMTHFTNEGGYGKKKVGFSAPYPGKIVPIDLAQNDCDVLCEKGAFLCAARGTEISVGFNQRIGAGLFGGEGFILQRLRGDGLVFVHAGGTIIKREIQPGETLRVHPGCLVALTSGVAFDIQRAGNLKSMLFGGEGLFLATLSGQGTVWLQSLPFSRMADRIIQAAPSAGGQSREQSNVLDGLGGIGRLLDGDS